MKKIVSAMLLLGTFYTATVNAESIALANGEWASFVSKDLNIYRPQSRFFKGV